MFKSGKKEQHKNIYDYPTVYTDFLIFLIKPSLHASAAMVKQNPF